MQVSAVPLEDSVRNIHVKTYKTSQSSCEKGERRRGEREGERERDHFYCPITKSSHSL
jgi:hypothetical protein